jgi:hypothetical protein
MNGGKVGTEMAMPAGKLEGLTLLARFGHLSQAGPGEPRAEQLRAGPTL